MTNRSPDNELRFVIFQWSLVIVGTFSVAARPTLVYLVVAKFTNWSNFVREVWLIKEKWNKRSCLKPPMNADARRCSTPLIGVNRRASAVPYPRRYEVCSLLIASDPHTAQSASLRSCCRLRTSWAALRLTANLR